MSESSNLALDRGFFGHPKGLQTLFFTEMWERMSYYGMRGLLVLFLTTSINEGGFAYTAAVASAIYGLYTASVYFMGLPGGWMADRLIGSQRAVWYGGIIIMCGHISLAIPNDKTFYLGLILVVLGTGLLKPSISALVGTLYSSTDERRDSGYAIYYMGINIGSLIGYTVCGALAEADAFGWHWAFGAAAVGMAIGLIQFRKTVGNLQGAGAAPLQPMTPAGNTRSWRIIGVFLLGLVVVTLSVMNGLITLNPISLAQSVAVAFTAIFVIYFSAVYFLGRLDPCGNSHGLVSVCKLNLYHSAFALLCRYVDQTRQTHGVASIRGEMRRWSYHHGKRFYRHVLRRTHCRRGDESRCFLADFNLLLAHLRRVDHQPHRLERRIQTGTQTLPGPDDGRVRFDLLYRQHYRRYLRGQIRPQQRGRNAQPVYADCDVQCRRGRDSVAV